MTFLFPVVVLFNCRFLKITQNTKEKKSTINPSSFYIFIDVFAYSSFVFCKGIHSKTFSNPDEGDKRTSYNKVSLCQIRSSVVLGNGEEW